VSDKTVGALIFIVSVLLMVGYFWWLFLAPPDWVILGRPLRDWALIVPVAIIVYAFLFIAAWIGKTMATTPPPLPVTGKTSEEKEETEEEG
jgi:hypothetical protein